MKEREEQLKSENFVFNNDNSERYSEGSFQPSTSSQFLKMVKEREQDIESDPGKVPDEILKNFKSNVCRFTELDSLITMLNQQVKPIREQLKPLNEQLRLLKSQKNVS